jgi:hypothetical protein
MMLRSRQAMIYQFAVHSKTGIIFTGTFELPTGTTIDKATTKAAHEGARLAYKMGFEWNPFEPQIAIRPIKPKRKQRRASHK